MGIKLSGLKKWFDDAADTAGNGIAAGYHGVNPFDGGQGFTTRQVQQAPGQRTGFERTWDQFNQFDGGRSWKEAAPQNDRSGWGQLTHNGATNLTGNLLVKPFVINPLQIVAETGRGIAADVTQNVAAQDAGRHRQWENIKASIPGFIGGQVWHAGATLKEIPRAIQGDIMGGSLIPQANQNDGRHDGFDHFLNNAGFAVSNPAGFVMDKGFHKGPHAPTVEQQQAYNKGMQNLNQTVVGQMVSPVEGLAGDWGGNDVKAALQAGGYDTEATGAQKYFANPVMGAFGTYGLAKGAMETPSSVKSAYLGDAPKTMQNVMIKQVLDEAKSGGTKGPTIKVPGKGTRPADVLQTKLEDAWNKNDMAGAQKVINQLPPELKTPMQAIHDTKMGAAPATHPVVDPVTHQIKIVPNETATPGPTIKVPGRGKQDLQTNPPLIQDAAQPGAQPTVAIKNPSTPQPGYPSTLQNRSFIKTVIEDSNTAPKIKAALSDLDSTYMSRNTKALQTKAANLVKEYRDVAENMSRNATDDIGVAVSSELIKALQKEGNYTAAVEVAGSVAKNLTEAGRMVQAASIYGKLTPEGVLRFAQNEINKYNAATGKNIKLNPTDAQKLSKMADDINKMPEGPAKNAAAAKLVAEVQRTMPSTLAQKLGTLQTMAQLLNPKTNIRNIGGNTIFAGMEGVSQTLGAGLDKGITAIRRARGDEGAIRTTGLPNIKVQLKGVKNGGATAIKEAFQGYTTGPKTQFELSDVPVFRGKILGNLEKTMNATLRGADRAAYEAAFEDSLHNSMKLNKVSKPTMEMIEQAHQTGLYRTFQDTNRVSSVFTGIKKGLNNIGIGNDVTGKFGLGDIILKYPKTPGNLLARGIDYSPAGMAKAFFEATKPLVGKEFNQKAFVDSFSRSVVGSGSAFAIGYTLSKNGIITAAPEKDKNLRNLQKTQGMGGYQVNASALKRWVMSGFDDREAQLQQGDQLVSYDWAQPIAIPISAGAALGKDTPQKAGKEAVNSLVDSTNTLAEQPLVQGVQRFFGNTQNNGGLPGAFQGAAEDIPASFVPTLLNQGNQLLDNTSRNMDGGTGVERATNQVKAKIPGLAQTLPASKDVLGEDKQRYQDGGNTPFNVLINPAFMSKYKGQPAAQEAIDLYKRTGETKQTPNTVPRKLTITGADGKPQDIKLTGQQQNEYQEFVGKFVNDKITGLTKDATYKGLPDSEKVNLLSKIQTEANEAAKIKLFGHNPKDVSSGAAQILGGSGYSTGQGDVQTKIDVEKFKSSNEKSKVIGDTFYFKKGDGSTGSMPKIAYEVEQETAQVNLGMDRAQAKDDIGTWMSLAEKKYNALQKKKSLYDPVTEADKVAAITLEQENLMDKVEKYQGYGGFKKGSGSGKFASGVNLPNISTGISSDLFSPVISQSSYKAPTVKLQGGRSVRVARAKSSVKIKVPKKLA